MGVLTPKMVAQKSVLKVSLLADTAITVTTGEATSTWMFSDSPSFHTCGDLGAVNRITPKGQNAGFLDKKLAMPAVNHI